MRADALNGGLSVPCEFYLVFVVAVCIAGFSSVSGVLTTKIY